MAGSAIGLVDLGYGHYRVDHSRDGFARGSVHINGIEGFWESFWGMAKVRLAKFKGVPKHTFHSHLKEIEWRYNNRHSNKRKILFLLSRRKSPHLGMTQVYYYITWVSCEQPVIIY